MLKLAVLASLALISESQAARWNRANNPNFFNAVAKEKMVAEFGELPLKGQIRDDRYGWSESYWPSNLGGIAYRWNHPNPQPFKYKLLTREELRGMSEAQIGELSPAELYDISLGDYSYSLTKRVLRLFTPKDLWWEGICHGWALAASNYAEPDKTVVTNRDGIRVPFGASDVKGLLSMHDAYNSKGLYVRVGERCSVNGKVHGEASEEDGPVTFPNRRDAERPECSDVNAGAFHIVLASMIGINSHGFVADVDRFNDVWNQPVTSYESTLEGEVSLTPQDLSSGVDRKIHLKTVMTYGEELEFYTPEAEAEGSLSFVSKDPVTGTPRQAFRSKNYEYILELDRSGKIIGGEWISETRPDMLWLKKPDVRFNDSKLPLSGLNRIYKPVIH